VRAFFAAHGTTVQDPMTGSLNAALAPWLVRTAGVRLPYTARPAPRWTATAQYT